MLTFEAITYDVMLLLCCYYCLLGTYIVGVQALIILSRIGLGEGTDTSHNGEGLYLVPTSIIICKL